MYKYVRARLHGFYSYKKATKYPIGGAEVDRIEVT